MTTVAHTAAAQPASVALSKEDQLRSIVIDGLQGLGSDERYRHDSLRDNHRGRNLKPPLRFDRTVRQFRACRMSGSSSKSAYADQDEQDMIDQDLTDQDLTIKAPITPRRDARR